MHIVPIPNDRMVFNYTVMINNDDIYEMDETFTLEIINSSHDKVKIGDLHRTKITVTSDDHRELFI